MIVHCHGKRLFRDVLANHIFIQRAPDFCWLRHANIRRLTPGIFVEFLIEDAFANVDATIADVDAWPGDQFANLRVALATKRAHGEVGSAGHIF